MKSTEGKNEEREMESRTEEAEEQQERAASLVHAHEKATVPQNGKDGNSQHTAVKHSVGHYVERREKTPLKGLRRHRG